MKQRFDAEDAVRNTATGEIIRATSEEHVFELCGVPYKEPHRRL